MCSCLNANEPEHRWASACRRGGRWKFRKEGLGLGTVKEGSSESSYCWPRILIFLCILLPWARKKAWCYTGEPLQPCILYSTNQVALYLPLVRLRANILAQGWGKGRILNIGSLLSTVSDFYWVCVSGTYFLWISGPACDSVRWSLAHQSLGELNKMYIR